MPKPDLGKIKSQLTELETASKQQIEKLKSTREEDRAAIKKEFKKQLTNSLLASFGLVVGLAWNDTIKATLNFFFPLNKDMILLQVVYALILTLLLVVYSYYMHKLFLGEDSKKSGEDDTK
jgi:hypothetical protein